MTEPEPGVALTVATARAQNIENLHYQLSFDIPAAASEPIAGRATIRFVAKDAAPLVLDFAPGADHLTSVSIAGKPSNFRAVNGHIVIPAREVAAGENVVEIVFRAGDESAEPQPGLSVCPLRAGARAARVSLLRPAGPEGALYVGARGAGGMGGGGEWRRALARHVGRSHAHPVR